MAWSSSNRNAARARAVSVLPTPVGTEEDERADGTVRVGEARPRPPDRVGDQYQGIVLPHHAAFQALLHFNQLLRFRLQHPAHRNAGPFGDDLRHHVGIHLFGKHLPLFLPLLQLPVLLRQSPSRWRESRRSGVRRCGSGSPAARSSSPLPSYPRSCCFKSLMALMVSFSCATAP